MNKQFWLDFAEILDAIRLAPRFILICSYYFAFMYITKLTNYYLASPDKTTTLTAFVSITIPAITGIISMLTKAYFDSGRKWDK